MRRIILISGLQGSGKTALARDLEILLKENYYVPFLVKFADPLYILHDRIYEILGGFGIHSTKKTDGTLLQLLGGHFRNAVGADVWVNIVEEKIIKAMDTRRSIVVVDDMRYKNETLVWPKHECVMVRLECPEDVRRGRAEKWRENTSHLSETSLDFFQGWDLVLDTNKERVPMQFAAYVMEWLSR